MDETPEPRKLPGWVMVFMGIATAALVVIAVMSVQIRDAERQIRDAEIEQACYARAAAANVIISRTVPDSVWNYWITAWGECEERYQD